MSRRFHSTPCGTHGRTVRRSSGRLNTEHADPDPTAAPGHRVSAALPTQLIIDEAIGMLRSCDGNRADTPPTLGAASGHQQQVSGADVAGHLIE